MKKKASWSQPAKKKLSYRLGISKYPYSLKCNYRADGLGVRGKFLDFLENREFKEAWKLTTENYSSLTGEEAPDIRWRAHVAVWAAQQALHRDGDLVDCGVYTGILAQMICRLTGVPKTNKKYWLFDTWEGVPTENLGPAAIEKARKINERVYHRHNIYDAVKENFSQWKNCHLVKGSLPQSLSLANIEKVSFLSVDLNNAPAENGCIEALWPKLSSGAVVLIDDYGWLGNHEQHDMWDAFAAKHSRSVMTLPTGQGIIMK